MNRAMHTTADDTMLSKPTWTTHRNQATYNSWASSPYYNPSMRATRFSEPMTNNYYKPPDNTNGDIEPQTCIHTYAVPQMLRTAAFLAKSGGMSQDEFRNMAANEINSAYHYGSTNY